MGDRATSRIYNTYKELKHELLKYSNIDIERFIIPIRN